MAIREIIFRGKHAVSGEWIYGDLLYSKGNYYIHKRGEPIVVYSSIAFGTVGEYTGLTDKNGTKIFEGDICKTCFESYTRNWEEVGVVTEFCGAYGIESADGKHFRAFINETVYARSCEVIGNVHDNPELLENKE